MSAFAAATAVEVIEGADRAARFMVEVTRKRPGAWWRDDFIHRSLPLTFYATSV